MGESPNAGTEETVEPQDPHALRGKPGKQQNVHARIDKGCSRNNLERAWEKVKHNRGSAGSDNVTSAPLEARQEASLDRLPQKRHDGTSRPQPVTRVELLKADGGVRTLGLPAVLDRVCQQVLVQRMAGICAPTCLNPSCGDRPGRLPPEARRQVWQEWNAGDGGIVDADWRQCFDPMDQEPLIDWIADEIRDGRVLQLVRDVRRAGGMAGRSWNPTLTGVPHGGVARPLWSTIVLTPFDRRMAAEGLRRTRWADDVVVLGQTRAEAQRALALAERFRREEQGVERQPQNDADGPHQPRLRVLGRQGEAGPRPSLCRRISAEAGLTRATSRPSPERSL